MLEQIGEEILPILKQIVKEGAITEDELGEKLLHFELSNDQMEEINNYLTEQGVNIESTDAALVKDEDLKDIISSVKVDDPVKVYLKDIGTTQLLTSEQEIELAKRILNGDERAKKEHIEKIKTIGDAYMAAIFNADNDPDAAKRCIHYARGMLQDLETFNKEEGTHFTMRIGINTGSVVAGVIGKTKFIYDIWGDSVNVASRMESTGIAGKIHVSERIYLLTKDSFSYSEPVTVEVKGKGLMKTYFLE